MPFPTAIIAGVNKAGTTALFNTLASQSRACASSIKEVDYFTPARYGKSVPPPDLYAQYFPIKKSADVVIEATPSYFYGGEPIAVAIQSLLPHVRIVVMLREPGERAYSWWRFCRSGLLIDRNMSFGDYIQSCARLKEDPEASHELWPLRGLSGGLYSRYLPVWKDVFGDRFQIAFYEDWREQPVTCLKDIANHIGLRLDETVMVKRDNVTVDISNRPLQRAAMRANLAGEKLWRRFPRLKRGLRSCYYSINARRQQEHIADADRQWLNDYYSDELFSLRNNLPSGIHLPGWLR